MGPKNGPQNGTQNSHCFDKKLENCLKVENRGPGLPTIASQHLGQLAGTTWKHLLHYNDLLCQDNYLYFHVTSTKPDQHSVVQLPLVWSHFWAWKWTQKWDPEITYFSQVVGFALALVWACSVYWFGLALGCSGLVRAWFGLDLDWPGGVL